jgi:hypothetical protein
VRDFVQPPDESAHLPFIKTELLAHGLARGRLDVALAAGALKELADAGRLLQRLASTRIGGVEAQVLKLAHPDGEHARGLLAPRRWLAGALRDLQQLVQAKVQVDIGRHGYQFNSRESAKEK